jgi:catechol 2,3-dioxygenase-like lactoylglutathione lyase family enzyme
MSPLAVLATLAAALGAEAPARPPIRGISHVAFRVSDAGAARSFYEDFLGYRSFPAPGMETSGSAAITIVSVNDRQYVELRPGLAAEEDRLHHIALETDDAAAMRGYLAARGVDVPAGLVPDMLGRDSFTVRDPEGHVVELVQRTRGGRMRIPDRAGSPRATPVSQRLLHVGVIVGDVAPALRFYGDVLGFPETWRGSRSGRELSWINVRVPDGDEYVEFMLYAERPAPGARGTQHHICLEVQDIESARALLETRRSRAAYTRPLEVRVGTNRKRQLNLYDPDGTRVELMEPGTVDGQPTPSSTAPLPTRP